MNPVLGIDIGGTGIKAAPVDLETGRLLADRTKQPTPRPATPKAVEAVLRQLVSEFDWTGPIGITFPGVVSDGTIWSAANLHPDWVGMNARDRLAKVTGQSVAVINDADAAGLAEMRFGAGAGEPGVVLMLTLGTGIGSALFYNGTLVPNTEFGHIELEGQDAERRASERAREQEDLSWGKWAGRVDAYIDKMEQLLSPQLIIIGGGISRKSEKFLPKLTTVRARVVPATLHNDAGIVGGAMAVSVS